MGRKKMRTRDDVIKKRFDDDDAEWEAMLGEEEEKEVDKPQEEIISGKDLDEFWQEEED